MPTMKQKADRIEAAKVAIINGVNHIYGQNVLATSDGIEDIAPYLNNYTPAAGLDITDLSYMFYAGARAELYSDILACVSQGNLKTIKDCFYGTTFVFNPSVFESLLSNTLNSDALANAFETAERATGSFSFKRLGQTKLSRLISLTSTFYMPYAKVDFEVICDDMDFSNISYWTKFLTGASDHKITLSADNVTWGTFNSSGEPIFEKVICDYLDLSSAGLPGNSSTIRFFGWGNEIKKVKYPNLSARTTFASLYRGLGGIEYAPILTGIPSQATLITSSNCYYIFSEWQNQISDKTKLIEINLDNFFTNPKAINYGNSSVSSCVFGEIKDTNASGVSHIKGITNVDFSINTSQNLYPFGNPGSTVTGLGNFLARFKVKNGTTFSTYNGAASLYLAGIWRGLATDIPAWDTENKTTEDYVIEFFNSLGTNDTGKVRNIRMYSGLVDSLSASTLQIATDKNYTIVSTSTS